MSTTHPAKFLLRRVVDIFREIVAARVFGVFSVLRWKIVLSRWFLLSEKVSGILKVKYSLVQFDKRNGDNCFIINYKKSKKYKIMTAVVCF